ncbi:hypothetical protein GCM10009606_05830 [Nocardioides aquiterrae]|uniref:Acetyl-CoA carboxylase biotin carboxyl carrier protein subunit n=1 Tax=Nocardioides aquiterrae TaxID=203799 RepID=A0ABP4EW21_9ACTN
MRSGAGSLAAAPLVELVETPEAGTPVVELVETPEAETPLVELVETPEAETPLVELVETPEAERLPASSGWSPVATAMAAKRDGGRVVAAGSRVAVRGFRVVCLRPRHSAVSGTRP